MREFFAAMGLLTCSVAALAQPATPPAPCTSVISYGNNPPAAHFVSSGGIKIYYETYGTGSPLLILHGNGGSIARMACQVEFFAKTHRVMAIDSRGAGKSGDGTGPLTFEQQADDFIAVLDAERIQRADVLGQSDGGILALELGIRHSDRVLKLVASGPNLRPDATALESFFFERARQTVAEADRMIAAGDTSRDWRRRKRMQELDLNEPHISLDAVHSITAPTLLIGGDEDIIRLEHYVEMYHALLHGQLFIRPGAPHGGLNDPDLGAVFNAAAEKFLARPFSRPTSRP